MRYAKFRRYYKNAHSARERGTYSKYRSLARNNVAIHVMVLISSRKLIVVKLYIKSFWIRFLLYIVHCVIILYLCEYVLLFFN